MIFAFDAWELDTEQFELRHRGRSEPLEPKAFDLLHLLVDEAGRVVCRKQLVDRLWDGSAVSDAAIATVVKSARKALGDDGRSQRYIQTVRSRGFRFLEEVRAGEPNGATQDRVPTADPTRQGSGDRPVVAVLPFQSLGPQPESYFAEGLTGDLIANLCRFRELTVLAHGTTLQFGSSEAPLAAFCREVGADYAVEGSVRRAEERLRVSAQMVDVATGATVWADTYDRELSQLFEVYDEVTETLAAHLGVQVQDLDLRRSLRKSRAELDAHDCVLRARRFTSTLSAESHAEARDLLERAVRLDPGSADAHALLANTVLAEHRFDLNPRPGSVERALELARRATALDPRNAYARCWLAIVHFFRRENGKFEEEASRALALNPNDPEILADIGHYFSFMGQFERGAQLSRRAMELNPLHPGWYFFCFARRHYDQRRYEDALHDVERINLPHFYWMHLLSAAALGQLGRVEAAEAVQRIHELKPDFSAREELLKWNAAPGDLEHLLEGLRKAGLGEGGEG